MIVRWVWLTVPAHRDRVYRYFILVGPLDNVYHLLGRCWVHGSGRDKFFLFNKVEGIVSIWIYERF